MIGNLRRNLILRKKDKLTKAIATATGYKKTQLETKLNDLNRKYFPKLAWNSKENGTYRKRKNETKK